MKRKKVVGGRVKVNTPSKGNLRAFSVNSGLPTPTHMMEEIQEMMDVLLGRTPPPLDAGYLTLMETADAYYSRAAEMVILIHEAEREGRITTGSAYSKFRTKELREFMELAKRAADLGSRRLTNEQIRIEQERLGRESKGDY